MDEVCNICGHRGFSNALLECSECSVVYAHQYCLGIPPGAIDDTFDWVCEYCSVPIESESCQKFEGRNEIVALPEELVPLCELPSMHYHEYSTIEKACKLSRKQEVPMSSFMEHPDSIMRPLGEVFIDKERSFYKSSYFSSIASGSCNDTGTIELHENKSTNGTDVTRYTSSEIDGCEEKDDTPLLSASSKLDGSWGSDDEITGLRKFFDYPEENDATAHIIGSSVEENLGLGKRNRALEPEVEEVIQPKEGTEYEVEVYDEGPSSGPSGNSNAKHELINRKTERELSLRTALTHTQRYVRNQIVTMLLSACWTVELRTRKSGINMNKEEKVYVSPQGTAYWSLPRAYRSLERAVMEATAKKSENGDRYGNSNFCFKPLPKEFLSVLSRGKRIKTLVDRVES